MVKQTHVVPNSDFVYYKTPQKTPLSHKMLFYYLDPAFYAISLFAKMANLSLLR